MFKISFLQNKITKKNYTEDNNKFIKKNYEHYKKYRENLKNLKNYINNLNFDNNNIF